MADVRTDTRGVSQLIGALFVFSSLIIAFSFYQAGFVPQQNEKIEFDHSNAVINDMKDVRSTIVSLSERGGARTVSVQLGTSYPNRILGVNPPSPSGTLETTRQGKIRFLNDNFNATELCGYEPTTRSLIYRPNYNEYENAGKTVYDNTVLYQNFSGDYIIESEQTIVNNRTIFLAPLNRTYSKTSSESVSLTFKAGPQNGTTVSTDSEVNLTFPSDLPPSVWESNENLLGDAEAVKRVTEADEAQFPNSITVTLEEGLYTVKCRAVGIQNAPRSGQSVILSLAGPNVTSITGPSSSVPQGDQFDLEATISDKNKGGEDIESAQWRDATNTSHNGTMTAVDGAFDQAKEDVRDLGIDTGGWSTGDHTIEVRGIDAQGNIGSWRSVNVTIESTGGGSGVTLIEGITFKNQNDRLAIYQYNDDSTFSSSEKPNKIGGVLDWENDGSVDDIPYYDNSGKLKVYDKSSDSNSVNSNVKVKSMGFAGDFDLDGNVSEVLFKGNNNGYLRVARDSGGSLETIPVTVAVTGNNITPKEKRMTGTADIDSDGELEFAYVSSNNQRLVIADIINVSSTEISVRRQTITTYKIKKLGGIGDLDGDGSTDDITVTTNDDQRAHYYDFSRDALFLYADEKPKKLGPTIDTDGDDNYEVYFKDQNDYLVYREVGNSTIVTVRVNGNRIKPKQIGGGN